MAKRQAQKNKIQAKSEAQDRFKIPYYLVLCFFFISGMTGLIYEILWTRMIVKIIGSAPFAVSIVLTVFMGGLGLGSYLASRSIDRLKTPGALVKIYGILELTVGVYGLVLPALLVLFKPLYALLYNHLFGHFLVYNLLTFLGCSFLLILPVTCMGATLPVLSRFYVTSLSRIGASLGRLYSINTIGGALGALFCGFWIINFWGVWGSLAFAILLNTVIGLSSIYLGTRKPGDGIPRERDEPSGARQPEYARMIGIAALVIFAVSGFCSMAYEVIWTKLLGLIVGPTTYSFTVVLVTFITGLAAGSMFFGWLADRTGKPGFLLVATQIAAAVSALFISQVLGSSQTFFAKLIFTFKDNFTLLMMVKSLTLFSFMLFPTFFLGATFPLVGKLYTRSLDAIGKSIGFAYSINTLGAVLGSFAAGFVLIPLLGKEHSLSLLAVMQLFTILIAGGIITVTARKKVALLVPLVLAVLLGIMAAAYYPHWDRRLLSIGKYQRFDKPMLNSMGWYESLGKGNQKMAAKTSEQLVFFGDGIGGFTTVMKFINIDGKIDFSLYNSGKADASTMKMDMTTQILLAHFPLLFHQSPKQVLVLGLASGITAGETLYYPIEKLDVIDINQQVVAASNFFRRWNNNVLSNPKTELIVQDGRAHMELTRRKYDVVISEPSNPWMAGLATLFTREFFELVKERLNDKGVFVQWVHSYQMDWDTFTLIGRTFHAVFPNCKLVRTSDVFPDYLLIGFKGDGGLDMGTAEKNMQYAIKSPNMVLLDPRVFYDLIVNEDFEKLCGQGPIHTDNRPQLEFSAPRLMYLEDFTIRDNLVKKRWLTPGTERIIREVYSDVNAQIDKAVLTLSFNTPLPNMVDLSKASPEQKARYSAVLSSYCSENVVEDFTFISDPELQKMCISAQIEAMQKKINTVRNKDRLFSHIANLYNLLKMPQEAISYYTLAIETNPRNEVAYINLGNLLAEQDLFDEAIRMYREAVQINPLYAKSFYNWGCLLARQGKLVEAEEKLRRALSLDPEFALSHRSLGDVLTKLGKSAEGNEHLEEAAKLGQNQSTAVK
ncbi:MAG: fused MFS/spermidine synthase [Candidatus Latescibacter sp.]|nr:fused MFS/spermidine synthase [Candidatus Latescibacter sp.]